ncbi:hemolysin type calcium-binding protein [Limimaricola soesokkakensis]|uniref:Hemolysin type calcium-binding protein n=1 Tax=Limimaricola soesokkakensis TaxID=1343159 RepID=A0A2P8C8U8_9RHOB|nr:cadherin domain-containing protein [Limimaricola soesokkakensis]PSK81381.1 hemolysin type calcium-binding protein [Limimaricola soesokkakensis]
MNHIGPIADDDGADDRLSETAHVGSTVGVKVSASDPDAADTVTYATDDDRFTVDADGTVRVADGAHFDHETEPSISLTVTATSSDTTTSTRVFSLTVDDVNEAPVIDVVRGSGRIDSSNFAASGAGYTVTARQITDSGDLSAPSTALVTHSSHGLGVVGSTGSGAPANQLGYDAGRLLSEEMIVSFDAAVASAEVSIAALWSSENGTYEVGRYVLYMNGAQVGDSDFASPTHHQGTVLQIDPGVAFDQIVFSATPYGDQGNITNNSSDYFIHNISYHSATGVAEDATTGTVAATLVAQDPDTGDSVTLSLVDGSGNVVVDGNFELVGDEIRVKAGATLDRETAGVQRLTVRATDDQGLYQDLSVDIHVLDANEHAIGSVADADGATPDRIDETAGAGTLVGIRASAADADATATVSYAVDDARFSIAADGTVRVAAGASFDAETEPSIALTVTATSSDGSSAVQRFDIAVADINEHAIGSVSDADGATPDRIDETAGEGTPVGIRASAADADATATVSYAVDDARFSIAADGTVRVAAGASFDAETEPSIALTVTATSSDGSSAQQRFDIAVADINEAPTWLSVSTLAVEENVAGAVVGQITVADVDDGSGHDFTVSDARFEVASGQLRLKSGVMLDYEVEPSIEFHLIATDTDGLSFGRDLTINVADVFDFAVTEFADYLVGNFAANEVDALGGDDTIIGRAGDDMLCGGAGDDRIAAGGGDDHAHGNEGNDSLKGGTGNDRLLGGAGHDTLIGGRGADVILGSWGTDLLRGKAGQDQLFGGRESDWLGGGRGRDVLFGNRGDDEVRGHVGADRLRGGHGADELHGGMGADRLNGGLGNDVLKGGKGADIMRGSSGQDLLHGGHGRDELFGGRSADILGGGRGGDRLQGGNGDDTLKGGKGNDLLRGGNDDDQLHGGRGADRILGGIGNDTVSGGLGGDVFVFKKMRAGEVETILDFKDGIDVIELHGVAPELVRESIFDAVRDGDGDHAEVVIKGQILKFKGVNASSLSLDDFVLV